MAANPGLAGLPPGPRSAFMPPGQSVGRPGRWWAIGTDNNGVTSIAIGTERCYRISVDDVPRAVTGVAVEARGIAASASILVGLRSDNDGFPDQLMWQRELFTDPGPTWYTFDTPTFQVKYLWFSWAGQGSGTNPQLQGCGPATAVGGQTGYCQARGYPNAAGFPATGHGPSGWTASIGATAGSLPSQAGHLVPEPTNATLPLVFLRFA